MRALILVLACLCTMPATANLWPQSALTPDPAADAAALYRAQVDATLVPPPPPALWEDVRAMESACAEDDLPACALENPVRAAARFCAQWSPETPPQTCTQMAEDMRLDDPRRLARAIAAIRGTTLPAPEGALREQVDADARSLALAATRPSRGPLLDLGGPAIPVPVTVKADVPTLADILPNGVAPGPKGLDAAIIAIVTRPDLNAETQQPVLEELRDSLPPEERARLPIPRVAVDRASNRVQASMIGDPMPCNGGTLAGGLTALEIASFTLPADLHGTAPLAAWLRGW